MVAPSINPHLFVGHWTLHACTMGLSSFINVRAGSGLRCHPAHRLPALKDKRAGRSWSGIAPALMSIIAGAQLLAFNGLFK
jgi:hypothetical protein